MPLLPWRLGVDQLAWVFTIRWTLGRPHFLLSTLSVFWPVCLIHALRMKVWYLQEISIHFWQEQLSKALKYWTCKPSLGQMGSQDGNTSYSLVLPSNGELKDPLKVKRGRTQNNYKGSSNCVTSLVKPFDQCNTGTKVKRTAKGRKRCFGKLCLHPQSSSSWNYESW